MKKVLMRAVSIIISVLVIFSMMPASLSIAVAEDTIPEENNIPEGKVRIYVAVAANWDENLWKQPFVFYSTAEDPNLQSIQSVFAKNYDISVGENDIRNFWVSYADVPSNAQSIKLGSSEEATSVVNVRDDLTAVQGSLYYMYSNGIDINYMDSIPPMKIESFSVEKIGDNRFKFNTVVNPSSPADTFKNENLKYYYEKDGQAEEITLNSNSEWDTAAVPGGTYNVYASAKDDFNITVTSTPVEVAVDYKLTVPELSAAPSTNTQNDFYIYKNNAGSKVNLSISNTDQFIILPDGYSYKYKYSVKTPGQDNFIDITDQPSGTYEPTAIGNYQFKLEVFACDTEDNIVGKTGAETTIAVKDQPGIQLNVQDQLLTNLVNIKLEEELDDKIASVKYCINSNNFDDAVVYNDLDGISVNYSDADSENKVILTMLGYDVSGNLLTNVSKELYFEDSSIKAIASGENGEEVQLPALPDIYYTNKNLTVDVTAANLNDYSLLINGDASSDMNKSFAFKTDDSECSITASGKKSNGDTIEKSYKIVADTVNPNVSVKFLESDGNDVTDAVNNGEASYFEDGLTAVITVNEKNFDEIAARNAIKILRKDVNGSNFGTIDLSRCSWNTDGDLHTLTINFSVNGIYTFSIESFRDLADNMSNSISEPEFMFYGEPPVISVDYGENMITKILNSITFGFFELEDKLDVKVSVTDSVSDLDYIDYRCVSDDGTVYQSGRIEEFSIDDIGYTQSATFTIPAQFRGNVQINAYNKAGKESIVLGDKTIIVDNINPQFSVSYAGRIKTHDDISYYGIPENNMPISEDNPPLSVEFKINESNFFLENGFNNAEVIVERTDNNGEKFITHYVTNSESLEPSSGNTTYKVADWQEESDNENEYRFKLNLTEDGEYKFTVNYIDDSGNKLSKTVSDDEAYENGTYVKDGIIIDTIAPVVNVSYDDTNIPVEGTTNIFANKRVATVTVEEHNFDPAATKNAIQITENNGDDVNVEFSSWTHDGDLHTMQIIYDSGDYSFDMAALDLANNKSGDVIFEDDEAVPRDFIVDCESPQILNVEYEDSVVERIIETITFGFYKPNYRIVVTARDRLTDISKIQYKLSDSEDWVDTVLIPTDDDKEKQAVIELDDDYKGSVFVRAYDFVDNLPAYYDDGKVHVFDNASPNVNVSYTSADGELNVVDGVTYCSGNLLVSLEVDEENFFEGKKEFDQNGVFKKYVNDFIFEAECVFENGETKLIKFVPRDTDISENKNGVEYRKIEWKKSSDESSVYNADVKLLDDGNYTFRIKYKDNSENAMNNITDEPWQYEKSDIKVDNFGPQVSVEYYNEQQNSSNSGYYKTRSAKVVVNEKNFNADNAANAIKITGKDFYGNNIPAEQIPQPKAENWIYNEQSDRYELNIAFYAEGNYTIEVEKFKDNALNDSNPVEEQAFSIDITGPVDLSVNYDTNIIYKIIDSLTFGFFQMEDRDSVEVTVFAQDVVSGVDYLEYVCEVEDGAGGISRPQGNKVYFEDGKAVFKIDAQFRGKLSAVVFDKAGNSSPLAEESTLVLDNIAPGITVEYSKSANVFNNVSYYNSKNPLKATININEANFFEGAEEYISETGITEIVNNVSVNIERVDENGVKHDIEYVPSGVGSDAGESSRNISWTKNGENYTAEISLPEDGDYTISISYTDFSGKAAQPYVKNNLTVDNVKPAIKVSYDNNKAFGGKYFSIQKRTATVTVDEHNFNADSAKRGIKITAKDGNNNPVNSYTVSDWHTNKNTHTLTITYYADAEFTFDIGFADLANNQNASVVYANNTVAPNNFCLDINKPTGNISVGNWGGSIWDKLLTAVTFNLWSQNSQNVIINADDNLSRVNNIYYYVSDTPLAYSQLNSLGQGSWISGNVSNSLSFTLNPNTVAVVYAKIVDNAGNITFISSDGIILDDQAPNIDGIAPTTEITLDPSSDTPMQDINGNDIFNGNVALNVRIYDPVINGGGATSKGVSSGLNLDKLTYEVVCDGSATQSGVLQSYVTNKDSQTGLITSVSSTIVIDAAINNSNNVQVIVNAGDNAGNSSSESAGFMIDITSPSISVTYDNNSPDSKFDKIFKNSRTATVSVSERNFNADKVKFNITNTDGSIPGISGWTRVSDGSSVNGDGTTYQASITYDADGDYTFDVSYTDEAGNDALNVNYGNSVAPVDFTIDRTNPQISVSYDNNSPQNGNYYNQNRTATITITEHNFETDRVSITGNATNGGEKIKFPSVSQWSSSGDRHYATISFDTDGLYNFDIEYTDKAGNVAPKYTEKNFYIDKTAPELSVEGVKYKSANKDDTIGFVIKADDTNFESMVPKLAVSAIDDKGDIKLSEIELEKADDSGKKYKVDNLESDGVYLLNCTVKDKAGNTTSKIKTQNSDNKEVEQDTVLFSVNRKGSTFILGTLEEAQKGIVSFEKELNEKKYVKSVDNDITITEINPDVIVERDISIQVNDADKSILDESKCDLLKNETEDKWNEYRYSVHKDLFADEASYTVGIETEDAAQNSSYSINSDAKLNFTVDKTPPALREMVGLDNGKTYNTNEQNVKFSISDKYSPLESVKVILNGDEIAAYNAGELNENDGEISLTVQSLNSAQSLQIIAVDAAGNSTEDTDDAKILYSNFLITTDAFTLFLNNTFAVIGTILGLLLAILIIILIIIFKRKKKEEETEEKAA